MQLKGKKIWILEPYAMLEDLISFICAYSGAEATPIRNREEVHALVKKVPPDLLIIHLNAHTMSGLEACRVLKEDRETRHLPILLTSSEHTVLKKAFMELYCDDYLPKPFSASQLLEKVFDLLSNRER